MQRIGFIGLGNMGRPMAKNVLKAGFRLAVHDVNPDAGADLIGLGAEARPSPRDIARDADLEMTFPPKAFRGDFAPGFMIDLAHKDLGLALRLGADTRVPLAVGAAAREVFAAARAQGKGRLDYTGVVTVLEQLAGVEVRRP